MSSRPQKEEKTPITPPAPEQRNPVGGNAEGGQGRLVQRRSIGAGGCMSTATNALDLVVWRVAVEGT